MPEVYLRSPEYDLWRTAIENDDPSLLDEAISTTTTEHLESLLKQAMRYSIDHNSLSVLKYLIQRGVDVKSLQAYHVRGGGNTSIAILEILIAHGWDINVRKDLVAEGYHEPFMWLVVNNYDTVAWCLDHGATVYPRELQTCERECRPILEDVAAMGSVATFELLRSKGAPVGARTLHSAVENAAITPSDPTVFHSDQGMIRKREADYIERMDMVRHLLKVVKLDVNASDKPTDRLMGGRYGTPICYIPIFASRTGETRDLTWLLLDHGADPTEALVHAELMGYVKFTDDVQAWRARQI